MSSSESVPVPLKPSELGTKTYWDECYKRELTNHAANPEDEGTVWFAETGAEEKMIEMLEDMAEAGTLRKDKDDTGATSFIDLGTGNGHLLFSLRDDGWNGTMLGVDYSASSVKLAQQINRSRLDSKEEETSELNSVDFCEYDLLNGSQSLSAVDVLLDKGTFDAVSLSSIANATTSYRDCIKSLLRQPGFLIITSCNWTEAELRGWIEESQSARKNCWFEFVDRVRYPSFRFGGEEGQTVVTLCFQLHKEK